MKALSLRSSLSVLAIGLVLSVAAISASHANAESPFKQRPSATQSIVIHLGHSTDDIHAADMALHMGANLLNHHARVTLFLDREGVRLADSRLPIETLTWSDNSIAEDFEAYIEAGGQVLVCPGCAANAGLTSALLRTGAVMGTPDTVAAAILGADKVIDF
jgi:sulfur relay (sulfurtransferase) complex TusBCD TusD component (DsrE family)